MPLDSGTNERHSKRKFCFAGIALTDEFYDHDAAKKRTHDDFIYDEERFIPPLLLSFDGMETGGAARGVESCFFVSLALFPSLF